MCSVGTGHGSAGEAYHEGLSPKAEMLVYLARLGPGCFLWQKELALSNLEEALMAAGGTWPSRNVSKGYFVFETGSRGCQ